MYRENIFRLLSYYNVLQGGKGIYETHKELIKLQNKTQEEIQKTVNKKLKNILKYAEKNIIYYNNLFKENKIDLSTIRDLDDLDKIPVINKRKIKDNFPEKITSPSKMKRAIRGTTSGSTGEPLEFYVDRRAQPYSISSLMFYNEVMGVKPFDVHWNPKTEKKRKLKEKISFWLYGKYLYPTEKISRETVREIANQIDVIRPSYIESSPPVLNKLARLFREEGIWPQHKPGAIISSSQTLIRNTRELVEGEFGSEVFDRYGHNEFSPAVAQECGMHDGYHINPLLTHIEIVDENDENVSEGEEGKILITDLNNRVMPFIRYDVGDLGVKGADDCPCGLNFPVLKELRGRAVETITFPDNEIRRFGPIRAPISRYFSPHVYAFQFIQHSLSKISLKIVPTDKYTKEIEEKIIETLLPLIEGFELELYVVDDIPAEPSGKTPLLKRLEQDNAS